jgi:hypothetical protein
MDLLTYLYEMQKAYKKGKFKDLKELTEQITNDLIQEFSTEGAELAILSYLLSKILTKRRFEEEHEDIVLDKLNEICKLGRGQDIAKSIKELNDVVLEMESQDKRYVIDILTKARIKIASKLYAKGISLGVVSKSFGIPQQEIMSYAGKTMMFDRLKEEISVRKRLKTAGVSLMGE